MTKEEFENKHSEGDEVTEEVTTKNKNDSSSEKIDDHYKFGWSTYSEITNGRFAMIGFIAVIIIELFSHQSFLKWAGIL